MERRHVLVAVSAAQLGTGIAGQVIALRERHAFDIPLLRWRGHPARIARDSWLLGTGLSAPVTMLAAQAAATAVLATRPHRAASVALGVLGLAMTPGYLVEREVHRALGRGGSARRVRVTVVLGIALSVAMAVLGLSRTPRESRDNGDDPSRHS